jgi:sterol 3beta-glucosyltransferase
MRVTILAIGSRGDVQPYIALGKGLQTVGHQVRIATHVPFKDLILSHHLDFYPLKVDPRKALKTEDGQAWVNSGNNQLQFLLYFTRLVRPLVEQSLYDSWNACQGSDVILFSRLGIIGYHIAEKLGIPALMAPLQPISRTHYFPCDGIINIPAWMPFRGQINWLSYLIVEQVFWQPFRDLFNRWRKESLNLPAVPFSGPYKLMAKKQYPMLYGFSPSVVPKPPDWGEWLHVTGYWFLDHSPDWQPPANLVDFITAGSPPICIGFGSMQERQPEALLNIVLQALFRSKQRAVLLTGWTGIYDVKLSDQIYAIEEVPHDWLFSRMAAVVHHGGAGTTAAGLRAGIPNVIIPFFADQGFWAGRVIELGAGPRSIPRSQLTSERLSTAIQSAIQDETIRARAALLGASIREENGVKQAAKIVDRCFAR